ncbi:metallophosphoesterase family protein [Pseudobdellovibrio sp. HCB154]|uniref:metallophosphoesterase family protein n=1 Tax=Pseudobdellovibrio sp. HCB154 TaxID=3386277 RepID=UPI0039170BCB
MKLASYFLAFFLTIPLIAAELQFGIIGDAGRWNSNAQMLLASMAEFNVKKLIMPGDNLYEGTYEQQWGEWKNAGFSFDVIALGNHNETYQAEIKFFQMPGEYFSKTYAFGEIQYLVLNSDNTSNVTKQMTWLKAQLKASTAKQIYLVYHHPTYKVGRYIPTEQKKNFQLKIRPLLKTYRHKITALIVGHEHITSLMHFDTLPVVISGCTQSPRDEVPLNNIQSGVRVRTAIHLDSEPFWVMQVTPQDITATDASEFLFIRGRDSKVMCRATIKTGQSATYRCDGA